MYVTVADICKKAGIAVHLANGILGGLGVFPEYREVKTPRGNIRPQKCVRKEVADILDVFLPIRESYLNSRKDTIDAIMAVNRKLEEDGNDN